MITCIRTAMKSRSCPTCSDASRRKNGHQDRLDQVPFKAINENLPVQLAAGQGPDLARVADLGGVARYMLDLRPHLKDPPIRNEFRTLPRMDAVAGRQELHSGFMTQLTLRGLFVNKTLFEQAKVAMPGPKSTWEDRAKASKDVATKVQARFPLAIDRSDPVS